MSAPVRALVLGGGGVTGIAWETGVLAGLAEAGVDLGTADVVVGTSAGSVVGAQLRGGAALATLYATQLAAPAGETAARLRFIDLALFLALSLWPGSDESARARIGRMAVRARTTGEAERRRVIESRLGDPPWPGRRLLITAVDAETGEPRVFDRESGVRLVDAVAASCAVPLVWPPVTIGGRRYVDGGVRSATNADLAVGCDRVVVLAPITVALRRSGRISVQLGSLGAGVRSVVLTPDAAARKAIGRNVLSPATRAPSARAGRDQGLAAADSVRAVWES